MHFDALTLAGMAYELQQTLTGGRVQQVLMPDPQSIGLEVYAGRQRQQLLITTGSAARIHRVTQKLRRGVEQPTPLLLLLRKYSRESTLTAISQPEPTERLLHLQLDHPEHGTTTLVVELLGQRSNVLLLNPAGKILDCLHRIWPGEGVLRPLVPGQPYTPPPPQARVSPLDDGSADYYGCLAAITQAGAKLWKALTSHVAGISPSLARAIAWRAAGDAEIAAADVPLVALVQALQALWSPVQTGEWEPGIWLESGEQGGVVGFSAYRTHHHGEFAPTASLSQAVEQYYSQPADGAASRGGDSYAALRGNVAAELRRTQQRVERQLAALAGDEPPPGAAEALRTRAEWLLALSSQVQPGQTVLTVEVDDQPLTIPLDPEQTPVAQAEQMFKRAARLERAATIIPERRAKLEADREYLAQLQADLTLAENQPEIAAVRAELQKTGLLTTQKRNRQAATPHQPLGQPRRQLSPQGFEILVGRNARQNDRVTFEIASASDLWLHVRDAPGSHVVIRNNGQPLDAATLHIAAQLAAYYSSKRGERAATVAYAPRRFVTRVPGGRPGQVYVRNEQTVTVRAELPEE
jgi:predicted ribosome quality control (RQC) complex YloA/Tae2 family protein